MNNLHFVLDAVRMPSRSPTPIARTKDVPGRFDHLWGPGMGKATRATVCQGPPPSPGKQCFLVASAQACLVVSKYCIIRSNMGRKLNHGWVFECEDMAWPCETRGKMYQNSSTNFGVRGHVCSALSSRRPLCSDPSIDTSFCTATFK